MPSLGLSCTQEATTSLPIDCSVWILNHERMLESLRKALVSSLEEKCSCGVSELYLQGWCSSPSPWFAPCPSQPLHWAPKGGLCSHYSGGPGGLIAQQPVPSQPNLWAARAESPQWAA